FQRLERPRLVPKDPSEVGHSSAGSPAADQVSGARKGSALLLPLAYGGGLVSPVRSLVHP
ncbi:MAG: hypothetical protein ACUVWQ_10980, partial [Candidatus Aminicenantales bacterium]